MRFIVTGGAGFIGSHLVETLLADSHQVTVIDNLSTGDSQNLTACERLNIEDFNFIEGSILTCQAKSLRGHYDGLVHLAATPSVAQSWLSPLAAHTNNISTTVAAIELCHELQIPRMVFASSAAVYGNPEQTPISETTLTAPISPYGLQKLASEQYIALFSQQLGISSVNLRLFNAFGPRQRPDSPYSGVISIFTQAMRAQQPLILYGDGSQTRDFVYVKDIAAAFKQALTLPLAPGSSLTCNIGSGKAISLLQLIDTLQICLPNWPKNIQFQAPRSGDIQHSLADINQATSQLNFTPQWSLQSGLKALIATM